MNRFCLMTAMAAALLLTAGCREEEEYARSASYGAVRVSPSSPYVGDTVTMTVEVLDAGHRIFHADYYWNIKPEIVDTVKVTAPNGSKTIVKAPTYKHVFTKAGNYSVNMSAKLKFSMATEQGTLFGSAISKTASFTVRNRPTD